MSKYLGPQTDELARRPSAGKSILPLAVALELLPACMQPWTLNVIRLDVFPISCCLLFRCGSRSPFGALVFNKNPQFSHESLWEKHGNYMRQPLWYLKG